MYKRQGLVVVCDAAVSDSNSEASILGQFRLSIGIIYQNQYQEGLAYAAVSRVRRAIAALIRERNESITYSGGSIEVASLAQQDLNKGEGSRSVVSEIHYMITAAF